MNLEWDERKRHLNIEKHGLDIFDAHAVFDGPHIAVPLIYDGVEERFLAIGLFKGRWVTIVYTIRREATRIFCFRRARYEERKKYQELYDGGT